MKEQLFYDKSVYLRITQNNRTVFLIWWVTLTDFVDHINRELEFLNEILEAEKNNMDKARAEMKIRNEINQIEVIDKL
jgi:hypothetical protein